MRKSKSCKTKIVNGVRFVESSNNVFSDLGFPGQEAINLIARSELMMAIEAVIKKRRLTQVEAAKILGVGQPRVSDLFKGKIDRFTVDMLMNWLHKLGQEVTVSVRNKAQRRKAIDELMVFRSTMPRVALQELLYGRHAGHKY